MRRRVTLSIIYGDNFDRSVDVVASLVRDRLSKLGVDVIVVYAFIPGSKTRICIEGIEYSLDSIKNVDEVVDNIVSKTLDMIISRDVSERKFYLDHVAAAIDIVHD